LAYIVSRTGKYIMSEAAAVLAEVLKPLTAAVVTQGVRHQMVVSNPDGRLAYSEAEAAAKLGLNKHQLRDARRRGEIKASKVFGRRIMYTPRDLADFLQAGRQPELVAA
jgi:hypothetical protein